MGGAGRNLIVFHCQAGQFYPVSLFQPVENRNVQREPERRKEVTGELAGIGNMITGVIADLAHNGVLIGPDSNEIR
ncbi:hypothetical protein D9M69_634980 [compost metagenome]